MKRVKKERKQYVNSAVYYGIMKDVSAWEASEAQIMANGTDVIYDRINSTYFAVNEMSVTDAKYAPLVARLNILHQFETFEPTRSVRTGGAPDA